MQLTQNGSSDYVLLEEGSSVQLIDGKMSRLKFKWLASAAKSLQAKWRVAEAPAFQKHALSQRQCEGWPSTLQRRTDCLDA